MHEMNILADLFSEQLFPGQVSTFKLTWTRSPEKEETALKIIFFFLKKSKKREHQQLHDDWATPLLVEIM